jgi:hypothetical protein
MKCSLDIKSVHLIYCIFKSWISLLIFCLNDLSIDDNGVLTSPKLWDFKKRTPFIVNTIVKLNPVHHLVKEAYMDLMYMKLFILIILLHNRWN